MKALGYGVYLQFLMDIRSRSLLITCYFGSIIVLFNDGKCFFTSIMPKSQETLMASMDCHGAFQWELTLGYHLPSQKFMEQISRKCIWLIIFLHILLFYLYFYQRLFI